MTLLTRNRFFKSALILMTMLFAGYIALLIILPIETEIWIEEVTRLSISQSPDISFENMDPLKNFISAGIGISITCIGLGLYVRFFQRVSTSQIFFVILFLISLGLEVVRAYVLILIDRNLGVNALLTLSQVNLGAHIFGVLALFMGSLYTSGLRYQHQGTLLVILLVISIVLTRILPFNTNLIGEDFLFHTGAQYLVDIMLISLTVLIGINYIRVFVQHSEGFSPLQAFSVMLLLVGKFLLHSQQSYLILTLGASVIILGLSILAVQLFREYFWY